MRQRNRRRLDLEVIGRHEAARDYSATVLPMLKLTVVLACALTAEIVIAVVARSIRALTLVLAGCTAVV